MDSSELKYHVFLKSQENNFLSCRCIQSGYGTSKIMPCCLLSSNKFIITVDYADYISPQSAAIYFAKKDCKT